MSEQWYTRWTIYKKRGMVPNTEGPFQFAFHPRVENKDSFLFEGSSVHTKIFVFLSRISPVVATGIAQPEMACRRDACPYTKLRRRSLERDA